MRATLTLALGVWTLPSGASDLWNALEGEWKGAGTVRGMPAEIQLHWRVILGGTGRYLRFHNTMRAADGPVWNFQAEALYLCDAQGACRGHWYDSRGSVLPLSAISQEDRFVVDWGDASTERGRTSYAITADGSLAITDEVQRADGTWSTFGNTTAERDPASQE